MTRVDVVFILLGIFCYFSISMQLKEQDGRLQKYEETQKKKKLYADYMLEQKRRESLKKAAEERRRRNKVDFQSMASTVEMLSNFSDQEVMRRSRITSGKF